MAGNWTCVIERRFSSLPLTQINFHFKCKPSCEEINIFTLQQGVNITSIFLSLSVSLENFICFAYSLLQELLHTLKWFSWSPWLLSFVNHGNGQMSSCSNQAAGTPSWLLAECGVLFCKWRDSFKCPFLLSPWVTPHVYMSLERTDTHVRKGLFMWCKWRIHLCTIFILGWHFKNNWSNL